MTILYRVTVESMEGNSAKLSLVPHGNHSPAPIATRDLALQLIVESHWVLSNGYIFTPQPSPEAELMGLAEASSSVDTLSEWFEMMHGRRVEISEGEYEKLQLGVVEEGVIDWGMKDGLFFKDYGPRTADFIADAKRMVSHVGCERTDSGYLVELEVIDPSLLEHLRTGVNWESTIQPLAADEVAAT